MKIFLVLLSLFIMPCTYAADDVVESETTGQVIVDRMSCMEIKNKMAELSSIEEPDEDIVIEMGKLKSDYRRKCMKSAGGRKTVAKNRVIVINSTENVAEVKENDPPEEVTKEEKIEEKTEVDQISVVNPEEVKQSEKEALPDVMGATEAEIKMFEELINLDMGLCADGTKPNKFGCCTDEIFKDMGNNVYACCPKTGGDCYPPLK